MTDDQQDIERWRATDLPDYLVIPTDDRADMRGRGIDPEEAQRRIDRNHRQALVAAMGGGEA